MKIKLRAGSNPKETPGTGVHSQVVGSRLIILIALVLAVGPADVYAAVSGAQLWMQRYDSGIGNRSDGAVDLAIDKDNNVYAAGVSNNDYAIIKYDQTGNEQWVRRYNGPTNGWDGAKAMAIDSNGNVYVTGQSFGSSNNYDYATIKYDPTGIQKWVRRHNGPGNGDDQGEALAVDSNGNVYVTGQSFGRGTKHDFATIKYDAAGNKKWVRRYNGPENGWDGAKALGVDSAGNVIVSGSSDGEGSYGYATVKYGPAGKKKWVRRHYGLGNWPAEVTALTIDRNDNLIVTGISEYFGNWEDFDTVKYGPGGKTKWVRRYNGPGSIDDRPTALAVDGNGNVFVTGSSSGSGTAEDYATIKYGPGGKTKWVRRYNGPGNGTDQPNDLAIDANGNVFVTGYGFRSWSTLTDFVTIKYDTAGKRQWVNWYRGEGWDNARALAVDGSGNVYVTGESDGNGTEEDCVTIKYGQ